MGAVLSWVEILGGHPPANAEGAVSSRFPQELSPLPSDMGKMPPPPPCHKVHVTNLQMVCIRFELNNTDITDITDNFKNIGYVRQMCVALL